MVVIYTTETWREFYILDCNLCIAALFVHFQSAAMSYPHSLECSMSSILQLANHSQAIP